MKTARAGTGETPASGRKAKSAGGAKAPDLGGMVTVKVTLASLSAMLQNPMTSGTRTAIRTGARAAVQRDLADTDIASEKLYRGPADTESADRMGFPTQNLYSSLNAAAREIPYGSGKKTAATATTSKLPDFMEIMNPDEFVCFTGGQKFDAAAGTVGWQPHSGRTVNQATKGANITVRPMIPRWEAVVHLRFNSLKIGEDAMKLMFAKAGSAIGIGDFRPEKRGRFGRFKVTGWEVTAIEEVKDELPETTYAPGVEPPANGRRSSALPSAAEQEEGTRELEAAGTGKNGSH